jgi:DNA-binding winged helix-turn-helix (wHTH) protein/putative Mn2+ efflux pump MntP
MQTPPPKEEYEFGIFTLDVTDRRLLCGVEFRFLAPKPFDLLTLMVRKERARPGRLFTKEELMTDLWGTDYEGTEESLVKHINAIRKALYDEERKKIVETVPTLGYRFNPAEANAISEAIEKDKAPARPNGQTELFTETEDGSPISQVVSEEALTSASPPEVDHGIVDDAETENIQSVESGTGATASSLHQQEPNEIDEHHRTESPLKRDDSANFVDWIGGAGARLTLTLFSLAVVFTPLLSIYVALGWSEQTAMKVGSWAQFLVILFVLGHSWFRDPRREFKTADECRKSDVKGAGFKDRDDFESDQPLLQGEVKTYTRRWRLLLASWLPLYVLFAVADLQLVRYQIAQVILNILNTWMILLCFNALNEDSDDQSSEHLSDAILGYILFGLLLVAVTVVILFHKYEAATSLTGIAAGVFMALFVGRLQSKFMGPRIWILYLFYSYTAIQPMVLYFETHPRWGIVILDFALILKSLLYVYVTWIFQSGLLLFYFARMKRTSAGIKKQRAAFRRLLK